MRRTLSVLVSFSTHAHVPSSFNALLLLLGQCSVMEYQNFKLVYRRYASLYFIMGIENSEVGLPSEFLFFIFMNQKATLFLIKYIVLIICILEKNELAALEFIHMIVETLDQYFEGVV